MWALLSLAWTERTVFFFFQAEDGIRDPLVTGVQTCALPIYAWRRHDGHSFSRWADHAGHRQRVRRDSFSRRGHSVRARVEQIGRASCREREYIEVGGGRVEE